VGYNLEGSILPCWSGIEQRLGVCCYSGLLSQTKWYGDGVLSIMLSRGYDPFLVLYSVLEHGILFKILLGRTSGHGLGIMMMDGGRLEDGVRGTVWLNNLVLVGFTVHVMSYNTKD